MRQTRRDVYHAGGLRNRVTLQRNDLVEDGIGGYSDAWRNVAVNIPAAIIPESETENVHGDQLETPKRYRIRIRYRDDIAPRMRLVEESREETYNIRSITDVDYRGRWMEISAEEGVAQ